MNDNPNERTLPYDADASLEPLPGAVSHAAPIPAPLFDDDLIFGTFVFGGGLSDDATSDESSESESEHEK